MCALNALDLSAKLIQALSGRAQTVIAMNMNKRLFMISTLYLMLAILFEVAGTTSMKLSNGFHNLAPSIFIFVFYTFSFSFLTLSLKRLEVSIAYAIWSGLGTLLIALLGVFFFHETMNFIKAISLGLIIIGVLGLRLEAK